MVIGTLSTVDCSDVAEKMLQYVSLPLPALLDSSASTASDNASATSLQDHMSPPPLTATATTSKSLPQSLLSNMSSSPQLTDHVIQPPRFSDRMAPKLPSFPNPITNNDRCVCTCYHDNMHMILSYSPVVMTMRWTSVKTLYLHDLMMCKNKLQIIRL